MDNLTVTRIDDEVKAAREKDQRSCWRPYCIDELRLGRRILPFPDIEQWNLARKAGMVHLGYLPPDIDQLDLAIDPETAHLGYRNPTD